MGIRDRDTAFHLLPYFSIDEVRYLYPEDEIKSYDEAMRTILRHIELDQERNNILVAHCFVTGAQPSESDRSAMVGGANMVGADAFSGFDYVALGHLHRAQAVSYTHLDVYKRQPSIPFTRKHAFTRMLARDTKIAGAMVMNIS